MQCCRNQPRSNVVKQKIQYTSLLCTLVKLNFAGLKGSDTLFIGSGFLRLVNRSSFNCRQIEQAGTVNEHKHHILANRPYHGFRRNLVVGKVVRNESVYM